MVVSPDVAIVSRTSFSPSPRTLRRLLITRVQNQGLEWSFLALSYLAVSARLYVRLGIKKDKIQWSDAWLLLGLVCAQGLLICDTITYVRGEMEEFMEQSVPMLRYVCLKLISLLQIRFATNYFFDVGIYFPKISIVVLYYRLVPTTKPRMRAALWVLCIITVLSCLWTFFADTFWCGSDPSANWWVSSPNGCSVFMSMTLMRINWSLNFLVEALNLLFPFPLLRDMKLSTKREKFSLGLIFAMGFITIAVSVGRFVTMVYLDNALPVCTFSQPWFPLADIWATAEFCTSIIIVSMIMLRPLLKKITAIATSMRYGHSTVRYPGYEKQQGARSGTANHPASVGLTGLLYRPERHPSPRQQSSINESQIELHIIGGGQKANTRETHTSDEVA
ncbi:hypothetical protein B0I35DRAFT_364900 [Stachybotrys elegans]|uniref:Rhodopsin domain-containing protein n=1 Tax=Stachybotrys elegans TaxID=80388 RepID=A0A8K0SDH2_9HYPO|nr:hypothetical protein B0I35DRAFT_364900 [Stachybotrys elegans]